MLYFAPSRTCDSGAGGRASFDRHCLTFGLGWYAAGTSEHRLILSKAVVVSLKDVVDAMDLPNSEWNSYLNRKTGEIVTVTDEDRHLVENEKLDGQDLPEWQRERLPKVREALESGDFVALPDKFEIHEWTIMERFASSQASAAWRDELLDAIHGAGAFRSFRSAIRRLGIEDDWFRFRELAFEEIAKDWLKAHDVSFR